MEIEYSVIADILVIDQSWKLIDTFSYIINAFTVLPDEGDRVCFFSGVRAWCNDLSPQQSACVQPDFCYNTFCHPHDGIKESGISDFKKTIN